jgi:hypothetical protein
MAHASQIPQPSIPSRLLDLLIKKFTGTMKHLIWHLIVLAGVVVYDFAHFGRSAFVDHFLEAAVPIVWVLSAMVILHSSQAALELVKAIRTSVASDESRIERPGGGKFVIPRTAAVPRFLKIKIWGTSVLIIGMASGLSFLAWRVAWGGNNPDVVPTPSPKEEAVIEPSYNSHLFDAALPLVIAPFSRAYIIRIHDNRTVDATIVSNDKETRLYWPAHWPSPRNVFPPESFGELRLSNHGNISVFNVSYRFIISIGAKKDPGGIVDAMVILPLFDLPANGIPFVGYIVNQSSLPAMVHLSRDAVGEAQGSGSRQTFGLKPRDLTVFDKLPLLLESAHKWSGDTILPPFDTTKKQ